MGVRYWESDTRRHEGRADRCFVIRYRKFGKTVSETVGWQSDGVTDKLASDERGEIVTNLKLVEGHFSLAEKRQAELASRKASENEDVNLEQVFEEFLKTRELKPRTIADYERSMEVAFKDWKKRRIIDISRESVALLHSKLGKKSKSQANQHFRFLRSVLNFAIGVYEDQEGQPLLKSNPVLRLSQTKQWFRLKRKQTIIKPAQMPAWFKAVQALENETAREYLLFCVLTGCRKLEAMSLEIEQIDIEAKTCTFKDPKNRNDLEIPLGTFLFKLVKNRIESLKDSRYLFPGRWEDNHLKEVQRQIGKVTDASGVDFTIHDLRRVFTTTAESLDLSGYAIKRLINHSVSGDTTAGYVVSDADRLRGPMQRIENKILAMSGYRKKGKVVEIHPQARA